MKLYNSRHTESTKEKRYL